MSKNKAEVSQELKEILAKRIRAYPSLYKTGGDVINNILISNGTGWDWVDGEAVKPFDDGSTSSRDYESFETFVNSLRVSVDSDSEYWRDIYEAEKYALENAEEVAGDMSLSYGFRSDSHKDYAPIHNVPEDVTPVWQEAVEHAHVILENYMGSRTWEQLKEFKISQARLVRLQEQLDEAGIDTDMYEWDALGLELKRKQD